MIERLYVYRFELFLATQLLVLFGSLIIPEVWFENIIMPIVLVLNMMCGVLLVSKKKTLFYMMLVILSISIVIASIGIIASNIETQFNYIKFGTYFSFYGLVTIEIIKQVWSAKVVGKNVILGLISGYISLGLLAFFLCLSIEIIYPNSFSGIEIRSGGSLVMWQQIMYYSYITLMTIGFGDILPLTPIAQKTSIFIGLIGQFYLVILTAIVVGKYINQESNK